MIGQRWLGLLPGNLASYREVEREALTLMAQVAYCPWIARMSSVKALTCS
jgi:hypothetical protein